MSGSYSPNPSKTAPAITKIVKVWAGVSLKTSNMICPMTQISPPTTNAQKKIMSYHFPFRLIRHELYKVSILFVGSLKVNAYPLLQRREYDSIRLYSAILQNSRMWQQLMKLFRLHRNGRVVPFCRWSDHNQRIVP